LSRYIIEVPHSEEECITILDQMTGKPENLARFGFGCVDGDHRAIAVTEAENEQSARHILPLTLRSRGRIVKLEKFTLSDIKAIHEQLEMSNKQNRKSE
jgi:hypothetical protein